MTPELFETQLRNLDRVATPMRQSKLRETWRFEHAGKPYYLHFYPQGSKLSASGGPREYAGLKTLQDFKIPAIRVVAMLSGFRFANRKGNAIITQGVEPAIRLSEMRPTLREHRVIVDQIIAILQSLTHHEIGHDALSLSSFIWHKGQIKILDARDLKSATLTPEQLMRFAHSIEPLATRADRLRAWRAIAGDKPIPHDPRKLKRYAANLREDSVQRIKIAGWTGRFKAQHDRKLDWSVASGLTITPADWEREWGRIVQQLAADQFDILKRDRSGDILSGTITLGGHPIDVIIKRPRNKYLYRRVLGAFRMSRARRLWEKTRWLLVRRLPVEYPLITMDRRVLGYAVESIAIFEKVPGTTLDRADLDAMTPTAREDFFRACGRLLRRIEDTGLTHTDAKGSNWIVFDSPADPKKKMPVLIDAYGIRPLNAFLQLFGIRRLLRSMKDHPTYTRTDSLHLCLGFAPRRVPEAES
jgi:tRNA A-37 threonylcarbamoyl transferase component Bud32